MMHPGFVRIIAGQWRGRRLPVPLSPGLRPTPDRVRETLFNWLTPYLPGARCLDAFAGTGALGFEALSRGASYVEMVDRVPAIVDTLQKTWQQLDGGSAAAIYCAEVPAGLRLPRETFDIVFIDAPFQTNLSQVMCAHLEKQGFLSQRAHIYIEVPTPLASADLPVNWWITKAGRAGQVAYHLITREN